VTRQGPTVCGHWLGAERRYCRATDDIRHFLPGYRCPAHTPRALEGLPEVEPGPGLPAGAWSTPSPINDSRVHDARAVASGKRRSNPNAYKAARAAVDRKDNSS
jgi:hypothetical protein